MRPAARPKPLSPSIVTGLVKTADMLAILFAGLAAYFIYLHGNPGHEINRFAAAIIIAMIAALNLFHYLKIYVFERFRELRYQLARSSVAWSLTFGAIIVLAFVSKVTNQFSRIWAALWFSLALAGLLAIRLAIKFAMEHWAEQGRLARNIVIVGAGPLGLRLVRHLESHGPAEVSMLGFFDDRTSRLSTDLQGYPLLGNTDDLLAFGRQNDVDEVILALPWMEEERVLDILDKCKQLPVDVRLCSDMVGFHFPYRGSSHLAGISMLNLLERPLAGWNRVAKAIQDRVLATLILLSALPLLGFLALLIKLDSPGPVFFRQKRYGFNKKLIEVFKFRTMFVDKTDAHAEVLTQRNDPRVTRVGLFLRRTSLDELPQFINVLRGDMSVVGPRPHAIAAKAANTLYEEAVEEYAVRHKVKPGITGWAQIHGWRGETDTIEKIQKRVEHDLYYIENWSLRLDLWIILCTPFMGLFNKNAY